MTDYVSTASPFAFDSLPFVAYYYFFASFSRVVCVVICKLSLYANQLRNWTALWRIKSRIEQIACFFFSLAHTAHIQRAPHFASAALFQFQILICFFFVRQWISNKILFYLLWLFIALRYWTMKLVVLNFCICLFVVPQWSTINIH